MGDQVDLSTVGDDLEEEIVVENLADLVTVKTLTSGDSTPEEGDTVTFQIEVTNNGAAQAKNVSLNDSLPAGITLTNTTPSQGSYDAATGLWTIGTINEGDSATIILTATVDVGEGGNTITNVTTAAMGDQVDLSTVGDDLEEEIVVENLADLVTVKTLASGNSSPSQGDIVTFQIEVTNNGAAQATNVSLTDFLPAGLTATANNGTGDGSYDPATGLWTIGTLNNGESVILILEGQIDRGQTGSITNVTTAAMGDQTDPSSDGDDLEEEVVLEQLANLVTVKTLASGDSTPSEGDTVTFEIEVTNDGPDTATNVSLTDLLPSGLNATGANGGTTQGTYDSVSGLWTIGTLANGATATLTLEGTVDSAAGNSTITNVTTAATGTQTDPTDFGDDLTESVTTVGDADLVTVKTLASGDATPAEGDTVTFQIVVTNNGADEATNVSLTDSLPIGISLTNNTVTQGNYDAINAVWDIGNLANGASATITLSGTVDAGRGGSTITNNTTAATGDQNDASTVGDDLTESVIIENTVDLVTVKTLASGDSTPNEGDTVIFQIEVTNDGGFQATNVSLTDSLPAGITYSSDMVSQGNYDAATGLWTIGTLDDGAVATITLTGTVDVGQGGNTITNVTSAAMGDQVDRSGFGDDLDESVTVENPAAPAADLVTVKTLASGDATPDEGDVVTFEIAVTNNGPDAATGVSLTDLLPAGLTATANNGSGVVGGAYDDTAGLWTIGTLASGATATLTLEGTVDVGEGGNTITNITTAATGDQADPSTVGDDLEEAVIVNDAADLVTVKTLASGDATPAEGDLVTFQIDVTNDGAAQATGVSLTDSLPTGITFASSTVTQGSYDPATGLFDIGTLNVGEIATITLTGTVDAGEAGNTITNVTTAATGDQIDPSTAGDDLTEAVVVDNTTDLVTVKTLASGNATPGEGDIVTFEITVTNSGPIDATNVDLTDLIPAGLTATANNGGITQGSYDAATGLFSIGTLLVGETATLTIEGTVDAGEGGNTITNTTTAATGDQVDPSTVGDHLEESVDVVIPAADLVTVKTLASGDATPDEGDIVTFDITVTNSGPDAATNVSLTDLLPTGLTATAVNGTVTQGSYDAATGIFTIGSLASGATATLTLEGTVDAGEGGNTITNVTTAAAGDQDDPSIVGDDLEEAVVINDAADLVTVKTLASGNPTPEVGDTVIFQIEVTNDGAAQATGVSLTDSLPAGITLTGGSVSQGTYDLGTGVFTIGTLNVGESAILTLEGTVDAGEEGNTITNVTTAATGDQIDPSTVGDDLEEAVDVVDNTTDLVTVKTLASGNATPDEGDVVTFEITVTNDGPGDATNVDLTDLIPAGLTATANNGGITQGSYDAATGLFSIGTLLVGETATLTIEGTVDAGQGGNVITNMTTAATGDQVDPSTVGDDLEESVAVGIPAADLVTVKTLASGDATPDEGDTVTFDITVTNSGPDGATSVSLMDLLPAGLTATAANGTVTQGSYDPATGIFTIGSLASGATATLTLEGTVDAGEGGNTITNVTTAAAGDQVDPSIVGDDLEEAVVINDAADLVTVKTLASGNPSPAEGDTVTFQIDITNDGAAQATGVSLTDSLPTGITFTASTVSQGSYDPATGLFDIGTLNVGEIATITLSGTVDAGEGGNTITNITTAATGDQVDPSTVGDDLEEAVDVVDNTTDLVTVKTLASGNTTPDEGDVVTFEITVTNDGPGDATNVDLTDLIPAGLTATANNGGITQGSYDAATGLFSIGTLLVGETATLTIEGTVDAGEGGNTITNTTTAATGDQVDPSTVGDDLEETVAVGIPAADLVTVKTLASGDATPDEGDTVTFDITVTNSGPDGATSVSLMDLLPAGLTATAVNGTVTQGSYDAATGIFTIGSLASGATATLTLEGTVDAGEGGNTITNVTTAAAGDQVDPSTVGDDLEEAVVINDAADLVTVKTLASGNPTPAEGDTVTFQIDVTNDGAAQATGVSLTDSLPAGITFTASTVSQGTYDVATGLFDIGTLNVGEIATITLSGTVDAGEGGNTITNTTTAATGDQVDPSTVGDDLEEAVDVVDNTTDLVTVKTLASGDTTPDEGDVVTFEITVTNDGPGDATNVDLTDLIPAGLTATANNGGVTQGSYDAATGLFSIGTLLVGETATLTIEGTVDAGEGGNTITNTTTAATGDQVDPSTVGDDLEESVAVGIPAADLVTVKTLASGDATPDEGDIVTFDITVTNSGPDAATSVSLTDLLPVGLTATAANGTVTQGSYDPATGIFSIGSLASGATATLTLEGTVDAGQSGSTITNTTTAATGDQVDPSTVGDDLEESVAVGVPATDLVTVKTLASGDATPDEGDIVTFDITVTNSGPDGATTVSLMDLLPAGLTATAANGTVTQGSYDPATGIFTIGSLASGATATLTLEGTVDVGEGGNTITNVTTAAMGDQDDPSTVGDDLEEAVVVNDAADLVTVKTLASGNPTPAEGDTVTFQIDVTNNGGAQATNVSLTDLLPAGITLTGGTISQGTYDAATGLFDIGTLNVGQTATITLEGTVDAGEGGNTITNITTAATGDQVDPSTVGDDLEEAVDVVDNTTDLVTVKTLASGNATPEEGDVVTFEITVTNSGPGDATNVDLTDLIPAGLTATANNGGITQGSYDAATGLFSIGTLLVGESATLTIEGTVDAGQGGSVITNVTTAATGDQVDPSTVGDDLEESVAIGIPAADLVTVKTLASGDATPDEGDIVTFDITVTNSGPDAATNVSLADLLPAGLTATAANGSGHTRLLRS